MAACGKAHYTDIIRIDMPHGGTVTDSSNGIVCIGKRDVSVTIRHAICKHTIGDALRVEIISPVVALVVHGQMGIASTRTSYYGSA